MKPVSANTAGSAQALFCSLCTANSRPKKPASVITSPFGRSPIRRSEAKSTFDALPNAETAVDNVDRAGQIVDRNAVLTTMLDDLDFDAALAEFGDKLPGLGEYLEPDHPGMHTTATIDYEFVVSGRCILELDDGATREVGPGDTVVQNGTRHAWRNPFDIPCLMVVVTVGAHHDGVDSPAG